jgi:hypothetical protein
MLDRTSSAPRGILGALLLCAALPAQVTWQVDAPSARWTANGAQQPATQAPFATPAGPSTLHFPADASGKPLSLRLDPAAGDRVFAAVTRAAPAPRIPLDPATATTTATTRTWVSAEPSRQRLVARVAARATASIGVRTGTSERGPVGYWLVVDRTQAQLRLERRFDGHTLALAQSPLPAADGLVHELALQADGFALAAFWDDAPVLRAMDGALPRGDVAVDGGAEVVWEAVHLELPAAPRASAALVVGASEAVWQASLPRGAEPWCLLELRLDRPHALVPRSAAGLEMWLLQAPAAPTVLLADWRQQLGEGSCAPVPSSGSVSAVLPRSQGRLLRVQCGLLVGILVSPDGEAVVGSTPGVWLGW